MSSKIGIVIEREYMERVKKKSFIITTILMPLFMLALMLAPALIMNFVDTSESMVLVVDNSGRVGAQLKSDETVRFRLAASDVTLDSAMRVPDVTAVLQIPANVIDSKRATLKIFTADATPMALEAAVTSQVNKIVESKRLERYNIADIDRILSEVESNVIISTVRTGDDGEEEEAMSSGMSYALGIGMTMILYMFLLIYGQMVMTSIIEEKGNRVLEVVVTSVKPAQLMMGKIVGVALVAVTQILLWGLLLGAMSAFVLPALVPDSMTADVAAVQQGNLAAVSDTESIELIQAVATLSNVGGVLSMVGLLTLFLVLGFLIYSSIFAAVGSMVDNIQDASQFSSFAIFPIIFGLIFAMVAASDPLGGLAFWSSMFPLTAPMVMVARIPFGIPAWQIWLSLGIMLITFIGIVWLAGKIYRVGIFMYGKKPSMKEIARWISYK